MPVGFQGIENAEVPTIMPPYMQNGSNAYHVRRIKYGLPPKTIFLICGTAEKVLSISKGAVVEYIDT